MRKVVNGDLKDFLRSITEYESTSDAFNPWATFDPVFDFGEEAPHVRLAQLREYLECRVDQAKYLLVAEAVGYQGGKFSGIPMTSERMLLGHHRDIEVSDILPTLKARRTSNRITAPSKTVEQYGFAEPTATIVWGLIRDLKLPPSEVILWNIFPFHPFQASKGALSNRPPRRNELMVGKKYLGMLRAFCPREVKVIGIGEKAAATLGEGCLKVRHPANGGATMFREQMSKLVS